MRILLIEDEESVAEEIQEGLEKEHFQVDIALNGRDGLTLAESGRHRVILLDVMLPGISGWEVCETLRLRRITTPILMLTARDDPGDRVRGLNGGADDYLSKPFHFPELLARVNALIRRDQVNRTPVIRISDLEINLGARRVYRGGEEVHLTDREYTLLTALAMREGYSLTREYIQESVWGDEGNKSNTVDAWVHLLRKKVDTGRGARLIHTVHGIGYVLRSPDKAEPTE